MMRGELAHAKVNLSLRVLARETSGFHQIETLFCALELADEIEVEAGDDVALEVLAPPDDPAAAAGVPEDATNLAHRAAEAFLRCTGERGAHVRLTKRIPHGAGLGGGSSDAAAVLRALNTLHGDPLDAATVLSMAASLGSDVPFFATGAALALAWGRGGRLLPLAPLPSRPVLLVMPPQAMSTAEAYAALAASRGNEVADAGIVLPPRMTWDDVARTSVNDFESIAFARIPMLAELHEALIAEGAQLARMTGTGSVMFGVFEDGALAENARTQIGDRFSTTRTWLTRTLGHVDSEAV